ncbi:MAG TPA: flagellar export chaperone FliS [Blastocatellia bacterium]|nr:flagellar export chaperone FliS [Blastocatellia bacterium]
MSNRPHALAAYGAVANAETNPLQQIIMLYDGAIKFLRLAADDIERGDLVAKAEHSNRALDIVSYLQSILDFEQGRDVAATLDVFYVTLTVQILNASVNLDARKMNQAAESLLPVREAWAAHSSQSRPAYAITGQPAFTGSQQLVA